MQGGQLAAELLLVRRRTPSARLVDPLQHEQVGRLITDGEHVWNPHRRGVRQPLQAGGLGGEELWWGGGMGLGEDRPSVGELDAP